MVVLEDEVIAFSVEIRDSRRARWCIACKEELHRGEVAICFDRESSRFTFCKSCFMAMANKIKEAIDELSRCSMEKITSGCKYRWDNYSPEPEVCGKNCVQLSNRHDNASHTKSRKKIGL